jgi:Mrp family chromosome partitioning ATPase
MNYDVPLAEAIQSTSVEGLDVLTTGPIPNNPAEALMLPEFSQIIDELRMEYDLIVIDSPPMLACTDAGTISSTIADGVLFVMRIQRNIKPYSERSMAILKSFRVNLIGVVINAVGDSRYSSTYAASWSTQYGVYGSQYYYGRYGRYGGNSGYGYNGYLDDTTKRTVTVQGMGRMNPEASRRTPIAGAYASGVAAAERNGGTAVRGVAKHPVATNGHAPAHLSGSKDGSENGSHSDE